MRERLVAAFVGLALLVVLLPTAFDLVADGVLAHVAAAVVAVALAVVVGVVAARHVARPFEELGQAAADIGAGRFDTSVPRCGVREADDLGRTLRETAHRLDAQVDRERALAVTASHDLRTPLTALRLSLEDLTRWEQVPAEVAVELERAIGEVDRLGAAVTDLLQDRRDAAAGEGPEVDLVALTTSVVDRWRDPLSDQGRGLVLEAATPVRACVAPEPVRRVVDALVAYAATRGSGTVTVDVAAVRDVVHVRVGHPGGRRVPVGILHGDDTAVEDAGLTAAATTAEAVGGYLTVPDAPGSQLQLILPRRRASS
ncbi:MAG: HAMP domain-containing protein [Propionibacteriales bacterium]|nr:HAMP domain-containing protein [Propionibacteriales bacterium]